VEDVDVAYTRLGSSVENQELKLAAERYHWSGGADWGSALFYSEFLGKVALDPRSWEPFTGIKTNLLARQLGLSLEALYDRYAAGDNWQLIGSSYVGDKEHHQVLGDLRVGPLAPFLREILQLAQKDLWNRFPEREARDRIDPWFQREKDLVESLLSRHVSGNLSELYQSWITHHLPEGLDVGLASEGFSCPNPVTDDEPLRLFLQDYSRLSRLYNESIDETGLSVRHLDMKRGEMPCFAMKRFKDHWVRTHVFWDGNHLVTDGDAFDVGPSREIPREQMSRAGIRALSPKAILLVIQVRWGSKGRRLVLPYRGSLYTPASDRFLAKLKEEGLLSTRIHPIVRVRFRLFDRMRGLRTRIHLPEHLVPYFGQEEISASDLGEDMVRLWKEAQGRLERMRDVRTRVAWQKRVYPVLWEEIQEGTRKKRELGLAKGSREEKREVWESLKASELRMLENTVHQIHSDLQMVQMEYWDSRGAILPWCVALGGEAFYERVCDMAEMYEEPVGLAGQAGG